jgi:predicted translin family RNA/ssDNA-binding protein
MAHYRCYFFNAARHIIAVENLTECQDDAEAREQAIKLLHERPQYSGIAVWELHRKVFEELGGNDERSG